MKVTGIALVLFGVALGAYVGIDYLLTGSAGRTASITMIVAAVGSVLAGVAALAFGGRGYIVSGNPSIHN